MNSNIENIPDWCQREDLQTIDENKCLEIASELNLSLTLTHLLFQRNLKTKNNIIPYLYPQLADLPPPLLMQDMNIAISLLVQAFKEKMPVVIYGDYDVDGKSSTALLVDFLKNLDMQVLWNLPDRITEGYGLHINAIEKILKKIQKPALMITVDCGINAHHAVDFAKQNGFKVIITDHHQPPELLPNADAILNPRRNDCQFPFKDLAGVGVAFFYIMGIRQFLTKEGFWTQETAPNLKKYLDLVALGTVADVMPMTGTNRILVRAGLEVLSKRSRPGIWALCEKVKLNEGPLSTEDISYRLAPRINAAGRIGNPDLAVKLLLSETTAKAIKLANQLDELNTKRRTLEAKATENALEQCKSQVETGMKVLVAYGNWHPGVIGIISSRLVDYYNLPAIVFTDDTSEKEAILKGSGRSINNLNLYDILNKCTDSIIQFGGHAMAAGLTIEKTSLEKFKTLFHQAVSKENVKVQNNCTVVYDLLLTKSDVFTREFLTEYNKMEPFGTGNPEPVFILDSIKLERTKTIKNHLKFILKRNGLSFNGIGFGMGDKLNLTNEQVAMAFKLKTNIFRGEKRLELHSVDIAATP